MTQPPPAISGPLSVQVSTSEQAALNVLEPIVMPRQTLYSPRELHRHPWVKGGLSAHLLNMTLRTCLVLSTLQGWDSS